MRVFLLFTILASVLGAVVPQLELEQRSYSMWSPDDVQQRDQANCWWLSVLMAVAEKNPAQYSIVMRQLEKPGSIMKGFFVNFPGSGTTSTKACPMWVIEGKAVNTPSVSSSAAKWWPDALTYAAQHGYGTTNRFDWPINAFRLLYGKQPSNVESATEVLTDEEWPAALKLLKTANKNPTTAGFQRFKGPKLYASNEKSIPLSTVHAYAVDRISGKNIILIDPHYPGKRLSFKLSDVQARLHTVTQMKSKSTLLGREVDPEFEADAVDLAADHEVIDEAHLRQRATSCPAIPAWVTAQMKKTKSAKASTSKKAKSKTKSKSKLKA